MELAIEGLKLTANFSDFNRVSVSAPVMEAATKES